MPVTVTRLVRREGAVGEAMVSSVHLAMEARLQAGTAGGVRGTVVLLHTEKVRGQTEAVPRVLG